MDLKNADINCDILNWDYKKYEVKHFDFIWASPPCTEYSIAKTQGVRKLDEANKIVLKTIEIIKYLQPRWWVIEHPQTGLLKKQSFVDEFDFVDVDYCKYGLQYRKRARLWTNLVDFKPRDLCKKDCGNIVDGKHKETAQRMPSGCKSGRGENYKIHTQDDLYTIPRD